jgi:hypothetical protein
VIRVTENYWALFLWIVKGNIKTPAQAFSALGIGAHNERAEWGTINPEKAKEIARRKKEEGLTYRRLADEYGVSAATVSRALKRYGLR